MEEQQIAIALQISRAASEEGGAAIGRAVGDFMGLTNESQHGTTDAPGWEAVIQRRTEEGSLLRSLTLRGGPNKPPPSYGLVTEGHSFDRATYSKRLNLNPIQNQHIHLKVISSVTKMRDTPTTGDSSRQRTDFVVGDSTMMHWSSLGAVQVQ
eukprot:Em0013g98a